MSGERYNVCPSCRRRIDRDQSYKVERWRMAEDSHLRPGIISHLACPPIAPVGAAEVIVRQFERAPRKQPKEAAA